MEKKLQAKDYLYVGSLLFGLYFGAGNLIFPVHLGQLSGSEVFWSNLGFLVTGIGLPFLGVIAIGLSKSDGVYELAQRVDKRYAKIFTVLLYLVIGPFFAIPRLATTSYEIGISPFISSIDGNHTLFLALFSIIFYGIAWYCSRKPSKILDYVGKFLNPIFLLLLGVLLVMAFLNPMGPISSAPVETTYQNGAFFKGFLEGYNTLDALASLAFGIIIVTSLRTMGVTKPATIAKDTVKSGAIAVFAMGIIYTLLSLMGTMSLGKFTISENGGIALAQIAKYYLGSGGSTLLALIVITPCLKTAIGLITAFAETFVELFPSRSYLFFVTLTSVLPTLFANFGLTNIISAAIPVLMFIYPLAMVLIILTLCSKLFGHERKVYQFTTYFTLVAAVIDGLKAAPAFISQSALVHGLVNLATKYLPFFNIGMGWVLPALMGLLFGVLISRFKSEKVAI